MKYLVGLILAVMIGGGGFYYGKQSERTHWTAEVKRVQEQVKKDKEVADAHTKEIIESYATELANLRIRNGSPRTELRYVRVQSYCSSSDEAPRETSGVTQAASSVSAQGETVGRDSGNAEGYGARPEVITQTEWEQINYARFEENRIQLEALIRFVNTLYRDVGTR